MSVDLIKIASDLLVAKISNSKKEFTNEQICEDFYDLLYLLSTHPIRKQDDDALNSGNKDYH
jgi:hypothetical protein